MPTYDYVCTACDHRLEIFQSINSPAKKKCPKCGRLKLRRQIGAGAGILFKGSGFYETDYRSSEYKKRASEDQKASSGEKAGSKSDASKSAKAAGGGKSKGGAAVNKPA